MMEGYKKGMNINKQIKSAKSYRNPSIYSKLIDYFNIEEGGSNFPKDVFDPVKLKQDDSKLHYRVCFSNLKIWDIFNGFWITFRSYACFWDRFRSHETIWDLFTHHKSFWDRLRSAEIILRTFDIFWGNLARFFYPLRLFWE